MGTSHWHLAFQLRNKRKGNKTNMSIHQLWSCQNSSQFVIPLKNKYLSLSLCWDTFWRLWIGKTSGSFTRYYEVGFKPSYNCFCHCHSPRNLWIIGLFQHWPGCPHPSALFSCTNLIAMQNPHCFQSVSYNLCKLLPSMALHYYKTRSSFFNWFPVFLTFCSIFI